MKIARKIAEIILNIIIIIIAILIVFAISYLVQTRIMGKKYANIFGFTAFQVASGSMSGTINIGDAVIVKITDQIKENDIIVYMQDNNFITHRVIKIAEDSITTKGDANTTQDLPITKDKIVGKVIFIIPNLETWKKIITTPYILICIIITLLLFSIVFSWNSKEKKENEK